MKTYKIFIWLILLISSSCELSKEIDYDTYYDGDKLIVHGFISPQNGVQVLIKKSVAPNNVLADDKVQNATVTLYEDKIAIEQLRKIDNYHYSTEIYFTPDLSKRYSIKVNAENFDEVSSNQQPLFMPVSIDSIKIIVEDNTYYENLIFWFTNNNQFESAYYLKVYYYLDGIIDSSSIGFELFNPYGLLDNIVEGSNSFELQLYEEEDFDSLKVELYTLSPDLSTLLLSFQNYDFSKEDPFFEQTHPVFSNIENGYGIFASYSVYSKTIRK
jgi:hypothetical protein